jgi:F-type H+-transporting ATPase subunit delta
MNELYNRYALALLDLAKEENKVEDFQKEVSSLKTVFKDNPEFIEFLNSYNFDEKTKFDFIDKNLGKPYSPELINYIKIIVHHRRGGLIYKIFNETLMRFNDYLNIEHGTIYSTIPLDKKEMERIVAVIEKNTSKRVELKNVIDPSLIGGIKVVLKNDIYDASIKSKIVNLKQTLLKGGN